jgi:acetyl-CoA carboxylase/biotin carboxylase 1
VTGKVVRYLQDNGGEVKAGEPYVEVEAMKMIMPLKATESGKVTHNLSPGSVINAGDLLASLELKDPSKVKKILKFEGALDIPKVPLDISVKDRIKNILAGYSGDPEQVAANAFDGVTDMATASALVTDTLSEFLRVETIFAGRLLDDVVRDLTKANAENLDVVISENLAHQQLKRRAKLVTAMLRQVELFDDRFGVNQLPDDLLNIIGKLAEIKDRVYGEIALAADEIIRQSKVPSFESRIDELRAELLTPSADLDELSKSPTLSAGVDLLSALFLGDADSTVRAAAVEVYLRRVYRAYRVKDFKVTESDGRLTCTWSFKFADVQQSQTEWRQGLLSVIPSFDTLEKDLSGILEDFSAAIKDGPTHVGGLPIHMLHLAEQNSHFKGIETIENIIVSQSSKLNLLGVRTVNVLVPKAKKEPAYYTFPQCDSYKEDPLRRNMRPTFHHLLELGRLVKNFDLERLPAIGKNAQVYVGTEKGATGRRGAASQVVFVRGISHSPGLVTDGGARRALQQGLDELERALLNSKISQETSSRIFLHSLREIEGTTPIEVSKRFKSVVGSLKSLLAPRLLKLRVDEIEVKVRIASKGADGMPVTQCIRLVATSMEGEWLQARSYLERPDPVTGVALEYCLIEGDKDGEICFLDPYGVSNIVQTKRGIARRVGSTYAYDYLGLIEVALVGEWDSFINRLPNRAAVQMPSNVFEAKELIDGPDGELTSATRPIGSNKVGMVAWVLKMKTPEYPEGREVVLIANDVTVQSGSFGVEEDELYYKASKYARDHKLPRLYIACNAGARIGLVDELKPKLKIKFNDAQNPSKGFAYLYLTDSDYQALPAGAVIAHKVPEGWALDDVIGTQHGIGVENLQGSGKIAGETSKAYDEIFTLSYVTGRSVGIGAYLVRLGQRVIQMNQGPIILTGYSALNKLLGREVYTSQDQLGGPQIMVPNGVTHQTVENDQEGVAAMVRWLSFVPKEVGASPACRESGDPINRKVQWRPTPTPYDPRLMLAGTSDMAGFFDRGSFQEYLAGWGKSVVVGRGRLGGIPMGAIAVETRLVDKVIPADPADPNSREAVLPQAGRYRFALWCISCFYPFQPAASPPLMKQDKSSSPIHRTRRRKPFVIFPRKDFRL